MVTTVRRLDRRLDEEDDGLQQEQITRRESDISLIYSTESTINSRCNVVACSTMALFNYGAGKTYPIYDIIGMLLRASSISSNAPGKFVSTEIKPINIMVVSKDRSLAMSQASEYLKKYPPIQQSHVRLFVVGYGFFSNNNNNDEDVNLRDKQFPTPDKKDDNLMDMIFFDEVHKNNPELFNNIKSVVRPISQGGCCAYYLTGTIDDLFEQYMSWYLERTCFTVDIHSIQTASVGILQHGNGF